MSLEINNEIFNRLIAEAGKKFQKSELNKNRWGFSLCATPIYIGKPVIMGINWGGGSSVDPSVYKIQNVMPDEENFRTQLKIGEYNFIDRSAALINNHLSFDIYSQKFNYTNLCLFRTPKESDLNSENVELCIEIIKEYIMAVRPEWVLSFGKSNFYHLEKFLEISESANLGISKHWCKGKLWGYPFYSVPHPNAHLKNKVRNDIWQNILPRKF